MSENQIPSLLSTNAHQARAIIVKSILLVVVITLTLSCNMGKVLGDSSAAIEDRLLEEYGVVVQKVEREGNLLQIWYDIPWAEADTDILAKTIWIMVVAIEEEPRAKRVELNMSYLGEPLMALTANKSDIEDALSGEVGVEDFYAQIKDVDLRSSEQIIKQGLMELDLIASNIEIFDDYVAIEYGQPYFSHQEDLFTNWIEIADYATYAVPATERVLIHTVLLGQPDLVVEIPADSFRSYREGEIHPAELLASLRVTTTIEE